MDDDQRRQWLTEQRDKRPEWKIEEVSPDRLAERLTRWFPYLGDLLDDGGGAMLSPLVEITTVDAAAVEELSDSPAVIAVGPRSTIHRSLGRTARSLAWVLGVFSGVLLLAATLFTAVWVHLELYRHSDEITIMRLVGATESAIRGPFLVASLAPGMVAAVLAVVGTVAAAGWLSRLVALLGLPRLGTSTLVLVGQALLACGLPLVSALLTLQRHATVDFDSS
jgi:cell division protein FtsX